MGWNQQTMTVHGRTHDHGGPKDDEDEADWMEFVHRVRMISKEHRYARLDLSIFASDPNY